GRAHVETGIGFFDHMLEALARHALYDLEVRAAGDLRVDAHHTVEDVGIVLGQALSQALGERRGIRRYGDATVPLDEALARVVVDVSGRPFLAYHAEPPTWQKLGDYDVALTPEFFRALATPGGLTLHVDLLRGQNAHHVVEAVFKAAARAPGGRSRRAAGRYSASASACSCSSSRATRPRACRASACSPAGCGALRPICRCRTLGGQR